MESGLAGISKIFLVETAAKYVQQSFAINDIEPRYRSNDGNGGEMLDGALIIFVAMADYNYALDGHLCTPESPNREQSMINGAQRCSRRNQNRESKMAREIKHELGIVDGNENAAGTLGNDWPGEIPWRLNAL